MHQTMSDSSPYGGSVHPPSCADSAGDPPSNTDANPRPRQPQQTKQTLNAQSQTERGKIGGDNSSLTRESLDQAVRRRVIRTVYLTVACLLLVTAGILCWAALHEGMNNSTHGKLWLYWMAVVLCVALSIAPIRGYLIRQQYFPASCVCLGLYIVSVSYVVAVQAGFRSAFEMSIMLGIIVVVIVLASNYTCHDKLMLLLICLLEAVIPPCTLYDQSDSYRTNLTPPQSHGTFEEDCSSGVDCQPTNNTQSGSPPNQPHKAHQPSQAERGKVGDNRGSVARESVDNKAIRRRLIGKVYLIATCQLLVPVGIVCCFTFHEGTKNWSIHNSWLFWLACVFCVALSINPVWAHHNVRQKCNEMALFCRGCHVVSSSYVVAVSAGYLKPSDVLILLGITAVFVVVISMFAIQTKIDFTTCKELSVTLVIVFICSAIAFCHVQVLFTSSDYQPKPLICVFGGIGIIYFSFNLVDDTQRIMGGKGLELIEEAYILGAYHLYIDITFFSCFLVGIGFWGGG